MLNTSQQLSQYYLIYLDYAPTPLVVWLHFQRITLPQLSHDNLSFLVYVSIILVYLIPIPLKTLLLYYFYYSNKILNWYYNLFWCYNTYNIILLFIYLHQLIFYLDLFTILLELLNYFILKDLQLSNQI